MPIDRFYIGPYDSESGLQTIKAFLGNILKYTKGCLMESKPKRIYKKRCDIIRMEGRSYGDLTVIKLSDIPKQRGAFWVCKCTCGDETICSGNGLRNGLRVSCGCRAEKNITETGVNRVFSSYKVGAARLKRTFTLAREQFKSLISGKCNYCGIEAIQILKRQKTRKIQLVYNGIDRVNPLIGYEPENCVTCCMYCNRAKSNLTVEEFKNHIKRIYQWLSIDSI